MNGPLGMKIPFGRRHAAQRCARGRRRYRRHRRADRAPSRPRRRRVPNAADRPRPHRRPSSRSSARQRRPATTGASSAAAKSRVASVGPQCADRLGDQRMAPRGERTDFGGDAVERRCVGETGLGRKPTCKPIALLSMGAAADRAGHSRPSRRAGGVDQTGRHAGTALHRGL